MTLRSIHRGAVYLRPHIVVALAAVLLALSAPAAGAAPVDPPTTFGVPELAPGCPDPASDCTPPSDTTSGPATPAGGWFTSAPVDVTLGGADEPGGSGLARVEYAVDGGVPVDGSDGQPLSLTGEGDHSIAHRAVDNAGNASGWTLDDYAIDTVAPVNTTPETDVSGVASYTETITGTDAAPGSGVAQVFWTVDGGPTQTGNPVSITADGTHTLVTWVADAAGNLSLSHAQTVAVDASPPVDTTVVDPAWHTTSPVTVTLSGTGADHMEYVLDGVAGTTAGGAPLTVGGDGTHSLEHRAVDAAGNTSAWVTDTVRIDATAPVNTTTASSLWRDPDQHVGVAGTDATSGVREVQWQVDGGVVNTHAGGSAVDVVVTGEGPHTVKTQVVDNAGNASGWRTDTVKVDTVTPADLTSVAAGWQKTTQTVAVAGADPGGSGVASVEWSLDGGSVTTVGAATTNVTVSGEGEHTMLTRVTDVVGHASGWKSSTIRIDSTAPNNLTIPTDPSAWASGRVAVELDGADGGSGLAGMEYRLDGAAAVAVPGGTVVAVTGNGPHTLQSRALDVAGNASAWRSDTIQIDTVAPTDSTTVTSPVAFGTKATIAGTDTPAGVDHVEWRLDGAAGSGPSGSQVALGGAGPHVLEHRVVDKAGNASAWVTSNVTVDTSLNHDTTPPVDTTTVPAGWVTTPTYTVTVSGTDATTTVDHVEWRLDGGGPQTGAAGSTFTISGDGRHHFETRVVDVAGNATAWGDHVVKIDTTNPVDSTPAPAWQSTRTVKLDAADGGSGVDHMEWWLDGGATQTGPAGTTITLPADGTFTLEHRAVDAAGNVSARRTDTLRVDTVTPLDLTPAAPSGWQTTAYAVAAEGSDAGSGVDHVEARLDGDPVDLPLTIDSDGTHTFSTRVVDVAGNASAWRDQTVAVDTAAPADTTPDAPDGWSDAPWTVFPAADDGDGSGVTGVEWKLGVAGTVSTDTSVTISADGETVLLTRATDAAGHTSQWRAQTVRIDTVAPLPALACVAANAPTGYACTATATDATSGVAALRWRVDGGAWKAPGSGGALAVAKGRVEVKATDAAGNAATAARTLAERVVPVPAPPAAPAPAAPAPAAAAPAPAATHTKTRTVLVKKLGTHGSAGLLGGFELHAVHHGSDPVTGNADVRPLSLGKGSFRVTIRLLSGQLTAQRRRTMTFKRGGWSPRMGVALTGVRTTMVARLTVERRVGRKWRTVAIAKSTLKP